MRQKKKTGRQSWETAPPTVTPNITLMGELPVVDAFQSHPFNGHLQKEINTYTSELRPDLIFQHLGRIGNRQCVQPS